MDRIVEIDAANLCVVTQPGVINARLKAAVAEHGLFYAPDPASFEMCSIGGNLGTNAGGLCCVKYGQTRDAVLSLEVVMADGAVIRTGGKNIKDVAGYSLTHLIVGSQGTLALITEATLRLRPTPAARSTLLAFFPTLESAGDGVAAIAAAGLSPVTLELMDRFTIRAVDDMNDLGLDRDAAAMLMIESDLPGAAGDDELVRGEAACAAAGATSTVRSRDATEADLLRQARRAAHWALEKIGDVKMEDVGVPRSQVPAMLREIERIAAKHDVRIGTFGHAGDGNLHPDLVLERGDPNGAAITKAVQEDLYQAALDLGGTVTGEHGIGSARVEWLEAQRGTDAVRVMRAIKTALDPQGLLNPGASSAEGFGAHGPSGQPPLLDAHLSRGRRPSSGDARQRHHKDGSRKSPDATVMPLKCIGSQAALQPWILCISGSRAGHGPGVLVRRRHRGVVIRQGGLPVPRW